MLPWNWSRLRGPSQHETQTSSIYGRYTCVIAADKLNTPTLLFVQNSRLMSQLSGLPTSIAMAAIARVEKSVACSKTKPNATLRKPIITPMSRLP
jgi:hypothetical protein